MNLEDDPTSKRRVLLTPDNQREVSILMDAMVPRALFRYFKAFKSLGDRQIGGKMPTINLTKGQLRWIGRRVAPWEEHPVLIIPDHQDAVTAHNMSVQIADYLRQPASMDEEV